LSDNAFSIARSLELSSKYASDDVSADMLVEPVLPRHQDTGADRSCGRANLTAESFILSPIAPRLSAHVQPPGDGGANSMPAAALAGRGERPTGLANARLRWRDSLTRSRPLKAKQGRAESPGLGDKITVPAVGKEYDEKATILTTAALSQTVRNGNSGPPHPALRATPSQAAMTFGRSV
jgi:hypothetical protein